MRSDVERRKDLEHNKNSKDRGHGNPIINFLILIFVLLFNPVTIPLTAAVFVHIMSP